MISAVLTCCAFDSELKDQADADSFDVTARVTAEKVFIPPFLPVKFAARQGGVFLLVLVV